MIDNVTEPFDTFPNRSAVYNKSVYYVDSLGNVRAITIDQIKINDRMVVKVKKQDGFPFVFSENDSIIVVDDGPYGSQKGNELLIREIIDK